MIETILEKIKHVQNLRATNMKKVFLQQKQSITAYNYKINQHKLLVFYLINIGTRSLSSNNQNILQQLKQFIMSTNSFEKSSEDNQNQMRITNKPGIGIYYQSSEIISQPTRGIKYQQYKKKNKKIKAKFFKLKPLNSLQTSLFQNQIIKTQKQDYLLQNIQSFSRCIKMFKLVTYNLTELFINVDLQICHQQLRSQNWPIRVQYKLTQLIEKKSRIKKIKRIRNPLLDKIRRLILKL